MPALGCAAAFTNLKIRWKRLLHAMTAPALCGTSSHCRAHVDRLLAARKAQGAKLGNPRTTSEAAALGRKTQTDNAALFAANTLPIIEAIRKTGITDLRGIAAALTARPHIHSRRKSIQAP